MCLTFKYYCSLRNWNCSVDSNPAFIPRERSLNWCHVDTTNFSLPSLLKEPLRHCQQAILHYSVVTRVPRTVHRFAAKFGSMCNEHFCCSWVHILWDESLGERTQMEQVKHGTIPGWGSQSLMLWLWENSALWACVGVSLATDHPPWAVISEWGPAAEMRHSLGMWSG